MKVQIYAMTRVFELRPFIVPIHVGATIREHCLYTVLVYLAAFYNAFPFGPVDETMGSVILSYIALGLHKPKSNANKKARHKMLLLHHATAGLHAPDDKHIKGRPRAHSPKHLLPP